MASIEIKVYCSVHREEELGVTMDTCCGEGEMYVETCEQCLREADEEARIIVKS